MSVESAKQPKPSQLRLLVLTPAIDHKTSPSPFPSFLSRLTGVAPSADISSFAGYTSHPPLHTKTRYYESDITIWCDELPPIAAPRPALPESSKHADPDTPPSTTSPILPDSEADNNANVTLSDWHDQMLSVPAREVRDVIGGIILLLPFTSLPSSSSTSNFIAGWIRYIETMSSLRDEIESDSGRDVSSIVVLQSMLPPNASDIKSSATTLLERLEDDCLSTHGIMGWDFVLWDLLTTTSSDTNVDEERNEYGERTGFARIVEIVANTDWTAGALESLSDDEEDDDPEHEQRNFTSDMSSTNNDEHEFQREFLDLKMAMLGLDPTTSDASSSLRAPLRSDQHEAEEGDEAQVEQLGGLMRRVMAVREAAEGMSWAERERFARREVARIVDELDLG